MECYSSRTEDRLDRSAHNVDYVNYVEFTKWKFKMNTLYILILFAYVGPNSVGNSNAFSMYEFSSQSTCEAAGVAAKRLADGARKIEYVCTKR